MSETRVYHAPEWSFRRLLVCKLLGHRWVNYAGRRIYADWYVGALSGSVLWCDRCGGVK